MHVYMHEIFSVFHHIKITKKIYSAQDTVLHARNMHHIIKILLATVMLCMTVCNAEDTHYCRVSPSAQHGNCGMPYTLSNFQGNFACPSDVLIARPHTVEQLSELLSMEFSKVKAVGNGHSFNKEFLCAGNTSESINIVMTELDGTRKYIMSPPTPDMMINMTLDDFPIKVNEEAMEVEVNAGIPQRILLDYLSEYTHWNEPKGWTLPAFSWFIDQTIAGAVSTGTHGSTMRWGSLSSQVLSMRMMLANGTIINISPENEHFWKAAGVSVGQLGMILNLTMRILPQQAVNKTVYQGEFWGGEVAEYLQVVSSDYNKAVRSGSVEEIKNVLFPLDELEFFWYVPENLCQVVHFEHLGREPEFVQENIAPEEIGYVEAFDASDPDTIVFHQGADDPLEGRSAMAHGDSKMWSRFFRQALQEYTKPGVYESRKAYLSMIDKGLGMHAGFAPYNQFEVAIPLSNIDHCLAPVLDAIYGDKKLYEGFRTPGLVRFTSGESFYLSNAQGHLGPHMWINLEDYVTFSDPDHKPNEKFLEVIRLFVDTCDARLHWGKAGFQEAVDSTDYNVVEKYGNHWCDFGCAVHQLDPTRKFSSMNTEFWNWHVSTDDGQSIKDLGSMMNVCCFENGPFNSDACTCLGV